MRKCIIIGGGIAGLTSAVNLCKNGVEVELLESSPKLGGRAYSFTDRDNNTIVDNGQHVIMGCYKETLNYLKSINADQYLKFQNGLNINYIDNGTNNFNLKAYGKLYPLNLIIGILKFKAITLNERIGILWLFKSVLLRNISKYENVNIYDWLISQNQSPGVISKFWKLLAVSIMNTGLKNGSAQLFISTLRKIFLHGNKGSRIIIPDKGLSQVFCNNAAEVINSNGKIHLSEKVIKLEFDQNSITKIISNKNVYDNFDFVISAVPFHSLKKIYPTQCLANYNNYSSYSPITTIHLWLHDYHFEKEFYAFINSTIHWLFIHRKHVSIVISNSLDLLQKTKNEIIEIVVYDLISKFPDFKEEFIVASKIIKEKRATFISDIHFEKIRNKINSEFDNLIFAGDWTNTGLPSTIESAAVSGRKASEKVLKK